MLSVQACIEYFIDQPEWITAGDDTQYYLDLKIHRYKNRPVEREVVIVFQESNSKRDWKNNFRFFQKAYKNSDTTFYYHSGFKHCWDSVRDKVMTEVIELKPDTITITGWSLGGALALICTEDCWYNFNSGKEHPSQHITIHCVTFGAPRVLGCNGYNAVKDRWNNELVRTLELSNGSDIVTKLPPACMFYRHPVKVTNIGEQRRLIKNLNPQKYHHISGYKESLSKIALEL